MYQITRQQADGTFRVLDTADTYEDAVASARCEVDGREHGYTVYVFDQSIALVARVQWTVGQCHSGASVS